MEDIPSQGIFRTTQTRREFLKASTALTAAATVLATGKTGLAAAAAPRPNVILIMTDDQGYGDFSCFGNPHVKTPNLDKLHSESMRLTQYHNCPVCAPTRASLMTGRYDYRTSAIDTYRGRAMMHPDEVTLAEMFGAAGYKTGIFGKWHLGDCFPMRPCDQGFQESLVHGGGGLKQPADLPGSGGYFDPILFNNGVPEPRKGYCTDIYFDEAAKFIERHKSEPFFLYVPTNAPHSPLIVDDRYAEPYRMLGLDDDTAKYYGMVANVDENVGHFLEAIDKNGLRDKTIVVFMTDNGAQMGKAEPRFNAGMRGQKGTVYEGGIRVPCFIRWPGNLAAGTEIERLTAHIDIAPTLLALCGVEAPANVAFDGMSLAPLLKGESKEMPDRTLFFQWHRGDVPEPYNNCCARTEQYKLVNGVELYDLNADPAEELDIAAQLPDVVRRLRKLYEAWLDDVGRTRGYEAPDIVIGDERGGTTYLTLQDMRGGQGDGYGISGFWKTRIARAGKYDISLRFGEGIATGTAHVQIGGTKSSAPLALGTEATVIKGVSVYDGPAYVRAWANEPEIPNGARYVEIQYAGG